MTAGTNRIDILRLKVLLNSIVLLAALLGGSEVYSQCEAREVLFSEITYQQDSLNPLMIHVTLKAVDKMHCSFVQENATIVWGDGTYGTIPLVDTLYERNDVYYLKTYVGEHHYDTLPNDSVVILGWVSHPVTAWVSNTPTSTMNLSLATQATIDFRNVAFAAGLKSPMFASQRFVEGIAFQPLHFSPLIEGDSSFEYTVRLVPPYTDFDIPGLIFPIDQWPVHVNNTYSIDPATGNLDWTMPIGPGGYMITYDVQYSKNGNTLGSITRNMILDIADTTMVSNLDHSISAASFVQATITNNQISIVSTNSDSPVTIEISDFAGRIILQVETIESQMTILIEDLPIGAYFLIMRNDNEVRTQKFIRR